VDSLSRIIRYILSGILLGGIVSLLHDGVQSFVPASGFRPPSRSGPLPLFRDPICGTFVSPEISFRARRAHQIEHFCSEQCRDRYLNGERQAAGATW
jgi:YHS domain-containing protein